MPWFQVHMRIQTGGGDRDLIRASSWIRREASSSKGSFGPGHGGRARRGYSTWYQEVELEAGAETVIHVKMDRGKTSRGRSSTSNLPVAFARVSCQPRGDLSGSS